jgi:hypothetical protein
MVCCRYIIVNTVHKGVNKDNNNNNKKKKKKKKKKKSKAIPVHAWTGPEVSRSLRLPVFKTIST